jgi:aspartate/tyrosine/aromatic aminotransferase
MGRLFFSHITEAPSDPILDITVAFRAEPRPKKVNLSVGLYRDSTLVTPILKVVKKAEESLLKEETTKEYLPIEGNQQMVSKAGELVFGEFFWMKEKNRIFGAQCPGGTAALRVGGEFLKQEVAEKIAISDPTWPNHRAIFMRAGMKVEIYPYYNFKTQSLDFERCSSFLKELTPGTAVVLQASSHNPTGKDFSQEEWKALSKLFKENGLLPYFDVPYQGLGVGLEDDVWPVRYFASEGHELLVAYSFSKTFGLYAERVGALFAVTESESVKRRVETKIKQIIRAGYSNPPKHGAKIVETVLSSSQLRPAWESELAEMRGRIQEVRVALTEALVAKSRKRDFRFLADRVGMFCYTGLEKHQVDRLAKEFAIYMTQDGRINIAGLNRDNLDYVVDAILKMV